MFKYFDYSEFDSPDEDGSGHNMSDSFIDKLDCARHIAQIPFKINSGYRTPEHNAKVGGVEDSAHTKGLACDIRCEYSRHRYIILDALLAVGFNRIGIGKNYIHVDDDIDRDPDVIWLYK